MSSATEGDALTRTHLLRRRIASDLARIVSWIPDEESLYLFSGGSIHWPPTAQQLSALEIEGRTAWVLADACAPDVPVGHADLTRVGTRARIGRVIVSPRRRGERLGNAMMQLILERARETGATGIDLYVIDGNQPALRTYERLGFRPGSLPEIHGMVSLTLELGDR